MLLDLLPELRVLLDADLLCGVELVETAEIHVLGEQGNDVLVEGLPVRVLEVVPTEESDFCGFSKGKGLVLLTSGYPRSRSARRW